MKFSRFSFSVISLVLAFSFCVVSISFGNAFPWNPQAADPPAPERMTPPTGTSLTMYWHNLKTTSPSENSCDTGCDTGCDTPDPEPEPEPESKKDKKEKKAEKKGKKGKDGGGGKTIVNKTVNKFKNNKFKAKDGSNNNVGNNGDVKNNNNGGGNGDQ